MTAIIVHKNQQYHKKETTLHHMTYITRKHVNFSITNGKRNLPVSHIVSFSFFPPTVRNLILKSTPGKEQVIFFYKVQYVFLKKKSAMM
jgi:hypothetical protein